MSQKFVIHLPEKELTKALEELKGQLETFGPQYKSTETGTKVWGELSPLHHFVLYYYPSGRFYLTVGSLTVEVRPE